MSLDNGATWTNASSQVGSSNWTLANQILSGAGTLQVRVSNAGGSSMPLSASYALDTQAPTTTGVSLVFSGDSGAADRVTNIASQTLSGTLSATRRQTRRCGLDGPGQHLGDSHQHGRQWLVAAGPDPVQWRRPAVQVRVSDAAGNHGAVTSFGYTLDQSPPSVHITSNKAALKAGDAATLTLTFSEDPGAAFSAASLAVTGGTLSNLSATGMVRTAIFTPAADIASGTGQISVAAGAYADAAGNPSAASNVFSIPYDTLRPTATISFDKTALKSGSRRRSPSTSAKR